MGNIDREFRVSQKKSIYAHHKVHLKKPLSFDVSECHLCKSREAAMKIAVIDPGGEEAGSIYLCDGCYRSAWMRAEKPYGDPVLLGELQCNRCCKVFSSVLKNLWSVIAYGPERNRFSWWYKICRDCIREVEGLAVSDNCIGLAPFHNDETAKIIRFSYHRVT